MALSFSNLHISLKLGCAIALLMLTLAATAILSLRQLSAEKERLEALATRDALTGAYNRRAFMRELRRVIALSALVPPAPIDAGSVHYPQGETKASAVPTSMVATPVRSRMM